MLTSEVWSVESLTHRINSHGGFACILMVKSPSQKSQISMVKLMRPSPPEIFHQPSTEPINRWTSIARRKQILNGWNLDKTCCLWKIDDTRCFIPESNLIKLWQPQCHKPGAHENQPRTWGHLTSSPIWWATPNHKPPRLGDCFLGRAGNRHVIEYVKLTVDNFLSDSWNSSLNSESHYITINSIKAFNPH